MGGKQKSLRHKFKCLTFPTKSRLDIHPSDSCAVGGRHVAYPSWFGKWEKTGGKKADGPHALKSNEMAECSFTPQQPLVCDTFKNCEGLSRVAFMDGNGVVMLGKVISCERKDESGPGGKKK